MHVDNYISVRDFTSREDNGVRELLPHIGPFPILIPLKLFLVTKFKFQNVISFECMNIFQKFFQF